MLRFLPNPMQSFTAILLATRTTDLDPIVRLARGRVRAAGRNETLAVACAPQRSGETQAIDESPW
jgi:hypothetical protein